MQISRAKTRSTDALWIPTEAELATLPAALGRALSGGEKPRLLDSLGLIEAPALARPAVGACDARGLRRRFAALGRLCAETPRIALGCEPDWSADQLRQVLVGLQEGVYAFDRYRRTPASRCNRIDVLAAPAAMGAGMEEAQTIGAAMVLCRDLINTPAEDLGPVAFVRSARRALRGSGIRVRVLDAAACKRMGCGCILAVGRAGREAPRMLVLEWPGTGNNKTKPLVLCGKGVCFDTGGLNIKPASGMALMRKDMGGAATVMTALLAAVQLGCRRPVRAYLPLVENAIGPQAMRPGDILRAADGTTIEVGNTDAEGRLILADAIAIARKEGAGEIVTVATLTGAALVALGRIHVPVMGDDAAVERLLAAAAATGEKCWRLPLDEEHAAIMRGKVADLRNDGNGEAGCITAGAFLKHFAGDRPFLHCDISPASWRNEADDHGSAGATGVLVSSLVAMLRTIPNGS